MYDSTEDTIKHIETVNRLLLEVIERLMKRGAVHDQSKLAPPEKEMYDKYTPLLKTTTYGSKEYKQNLKEMEKGGLKHHYANNSHHPQHWTNGINGMSLLDAFEMICDWKAASMRHDDGSIKKSLELNRERFRMSDQLYCILRNTIADMRW